MPDKDPVDLHIGARLRAIRDRRQLTLGQVGREVGLTYQQIRKYESGDNRLSASKLYRLAELFGVEPSYFYYGLGTWRDDMAPGGRPRDEALGAALDRIEDPEVRRHLEGLINVLEGLGRS